MRRKRTIFIELTSLLDVILILLFVVLAQSRTTALHAAADADEAMQTAQKLRRELDKAQEQLSRSDREELTLGVVAEQSCVLTLSIRDGAVRRVRIEPQGEEARYVALGSAQSAARLNDTLSALLLDSGRETAYLVFQYDRNTIYHAEYELISSVIRDLKGEMRREGVFLSVIETDLRESD